jgi:hypothetical protein
MTLKHDYLFDEIVSAAEFLTNSDDGKCILTSQFLGF